MAFIAPAGTRMRARDLVRGWSRVLATDGATTALTSSLAAATGADHVWPMSSGRAAMSVALRAMRSACPDPERDEVVIPAYTCYSVPASVQRAGLRPRLCDVDPATLAMCPDALSRLDFSRVLAVVSSNLYGIPNPLPAYEDIARERGVLMLDDAAQAIGARIQGRPAGSFGDVGLYSFDKGKIICTIQGGALVARDGPLATAIEAAYAGVPRCPARESAANAVKLVVYVACLSPLPYGLIRRLPFLGLGRTDYHTPSPETRLGALQSGIAAELMARVEVLNAERRAVAADLSEQLGGIPGLQLPAVPPDAEPVYARFPVRMLDPRLRSGFVDALQAAGIGATVSYPSALPDVPEVRASLRSTDGQFPGARDLARQIITLPTHGYCPPDLGRRVREVANGCLPRVAAVR